MKKERFKNAVLTALVLCSFLLTGRIWLNERMWPEGYSFFVNLRTSAYEQVAGFFGLKTAEEYGQASILEPVTLAAYTVKDMDHVMAVVRETNENFDYANDYISSSITHALAREAKNITRVSEDDWQKALFTRGFYVDYGVSYKISDFARVLGVYSAPASDYVQNVRRFIITAEDSLFSTVSVFAMDEQAGVFIKIATGLDKGELGSNLALLAESAGPYKRFSFMINLNTPAGMAGEAVYAPYLVLNEERENYPVIKAENPIFGGGETNINAFELDRLLRVFSINPKTVMRYTDADENIIFVQSKATLKVFPDGMVTYTAVEGSKGIAAEGTGAADALVCGAGLSAGVLNAVSGGEGTKLYLSGLEETESGWLLTFDYMHNGTPVHLGGRAPGANAVRMEFEDGYLKSYTHILRSYEAAERETVVSSTYEAVDSIFEGIADAEERRREIEAVLVAYNDDGGSGEEKQAMWFLRQKGSSILLGENSTYQ